MINKITGLKSMFTKKRCIHICLLIVFFICAGVLNPAWKAQAEETKENLTTEDIQESQDLQDSESSDNFDVDIKSPSAILIEAESGQVIYEKNCDIAMAPASVTKIMTLLLTFEAMDEGKFSLDDTVVVSDHAASMGGSQCFFETGEEQTVQDMIKCIIIASGNDAAVAMAEKISGSEPAFVNLMNERAEELGMKNASFKNACGLDTAGHEMSARDISIMSRELITKHPEIFDYSGIWMDSIIHKTSRGESRFDLVNTNKFLNMYTGATGLKTGYTSTAKYCMSATAERDGIQLIAVIMGGETKDIRNGDACRLLDYGYSKCHKYTDKTVMKENKLSIDKGTSDYVTIKTQSKFESILIGNESKENVSKKIKIQENITAPVKKGDELGEICYYAGERYMGKVTIYADESVDAMNIGYAVRKVFRRLIL